MSTMFQDLKYGLRMVAKNPSFTVVAVLTLALGIGANTAIFSVADAIVLKPLPITQADRVVMVMEARQENPSGWIPISPANYLDWKSQNAVFEHLAAFQYTNTNLIAGGAYSGEPERLQAVQVSPDFFETLGVKPLLGRTFAAGEDQLGHDRVVILSYRLWQRDFGGDPSVVGKTARLDGGERMVIGVMPEQVRFPSESELWMPLAMPPPFQQSRFAKALFGVARLKPGVSLSRAHTEMAAIARRLAQQFPQSNTGWTTNVFSFRSFLVGDVPSYMALLMGVVGFVLLIACANVANLLLSRATHRGKEIALRSVLGASRWRLVRQLLVESVVLSLLGGTLGTLAAYWGVDLLRSGIAARISGSIPGWNNIQIDLRVLVFTLVIAVFSGLLSGLAPSFLSSKVYLNEALKAGRWRSNIAPHRSYLRGVLVSTEVAMALVLLAGAGLMAKGLVQLLGRSSVPDADKVLTLRISLPGSKYQSDRQATDFFQRVLERLASLPGVQSAALATALPDTSIGSIDFEPVTVEGPATPSGQQPIGVVEAISPDYFRTLQIPLRAGRAFAVQDGPESPRVAIVSAQMVRQFWPEGKPIGQRLKLGKGTSNDPWIEVVGVAEDVQHFALDRQPRLTVYVPYPQWPQRSMHVALRASGDPLALASPARAQVYSVDPQQPVYRVETMRQLVEDELAGLRYIAVLMTIFGVLAVTLAAVGIYGVMSYAISQRTHEIGIRMALGARPQDVLRLVTGQGLKMALAGVGLGVAGALGLARALAGLFYGVRPTDPFVYAAVGLVLTGIALVACYIPARRATKVDPMVALRYE